MRSVTFKDEVIFMFCFFYSYRSSQAKMRDSWLYSLPVQHFNILGNLFVLESLHTFLLQYEL